MKRRNHNSDPTPQMDRRDFLKFAGAAAMLPVAGSVLAACSKAAPAASPSGGTKRPIKIGFIALTDCTSILMAEELGYFADRGLEVELLKQASWPVTRDNLLTGQIDAAHCLFSMPVSLAAGIGGKPDQLLKIAMTLNNNGQAITLNNGLKDAGYGDLAAARGAISKASNPTFAMTFPGGTHDTWLRYWLKAAKVDMAATKVIPIPPPQMVANMKVDTMDGFCVGEPWNAQAVTDGIGFTAITTQDIWEHHPEKALVANPTFAESRRDDLKAVMGAILKASKWLDTPANVATAATTVGVPSYIGAKPNVIQGRMLGTYDLGAGLGTKTFDGTAMRFYRDGLVNAPRSSHVAWFLAQYQRFGLLGSEPDYTAVADRLLLRDLYAEVAAAEGVPLPDDDMKPFHVKLDDVEFDPANASKEAARA